MKFQNLFDAKQSEMKETYSSSFTIPQQSINSKISMLHEPGTGLQVDFSTTHMVAKGLTFSSQSVSTGRFEEIHEMVIGIYNVTYMQ